MAGTRKLLDLPRELLDQICDHLTDPASEPGYDPVESARRPLDCLAQANRSLQTCSEAVKWRTVELHCSRLDDIDQITEALNTVELIRNHPFRTLPTSLLMQISELKQEKDRRQQFQTLFNRLLVALNSSTSIKHVCLAIEQESSSINATNAFTEQVTAWPASVKSLELSGILYSPTDLFNACSTTLTRLRIQHVGAGLALDLALFQRLTWLHLEIDVRAPMEEDLGGAEWVCWSSSTWSQLRTFVISLYGDEYYAARTVQAITDSVLAASEVELSSLAVLLQLNDPKIRHDDLLKAIRCKGAPLTRLALVIPGDVAPQHLLLIAETTPAIYELTICAELTGMEISWSGQLALYVSALGQLHGLKRLALNIDVSGIGGSSAEDVLPLEGSSGSLMAMEAAADRARLELAQDVAQACPKVHEIVYLPALHPSTAFQIHREALGVTVSRATQGSSLPSFFWQ